MPSTTLDLYRVRIMSLHSSLHPEVITLHTFYCWQQCCQLKIVNSFPENLAKLGVHTKVIHSDGTFRTAPSTATGRFYQNLMLHCKFEGHVLPFFKVIMTGKSGALYKAVFHKIKEELPDTVNPETIMCDFETALQNGLKEIFPEAVVTGCWFHFSQV